MCAVIGHRRRHSVWKRVTPLDFVSCRTFFCCLHCDVICDLLQYTHTHTKKCYLFVIYLLSIYIYIYIYVKLWFISRRLAGEGFFNEMWSIWTDIYLNRSYFFLFKYQPCMITNTSPSYIYIYNYKLWIIYYIIILYILYNYIILYNWIIYILL